MLTPAEFAILDAQTVTAQVTRRTLSPVDVTMAALEAIAEVNPVLHALTTVAAEQTISAAHDLEARISASEPAGALAGVPLPIKDLVLTKNLRTTFGARLYEDYIPDVDDIVVARLRAAGAIIIGKTNVSELGYGGIGHNLVFPTTRNPWNPDLTSRGVQCRLCGRCSNWHRTGYHWQRWGGFYPYSCFVQRLVWDERSMGRVPHWPRCRDETIPGRQVGNLLNTSDRSPAGWPMQR